MREPKLTFPTETNSEVTLIWSVSEVRCVIARYDEARYQLRLLRGIGTVKTDLFADYTQALAASREWRAILTNTQRCDSRSDARLSDHRGHAGRKCT